MLAVVGCTAAQSNPGEALRWSPGASRFAADLAAVDQGTVGLRELLRVRSKLPPCQRHSAA